MSHRVLVTAVGGNIGQGVVKALRHGSRDYEIIGADMEPRSAGFAFVDRAHLTPAAADPLFLERMTALIRAERIETIFVCSPQELAVFTLMRGDLEAATGVRILLNPDHVVRIGQDKLETARFLDAHGFAAPETAPVEDAAAVDALIARWGFPVIVKPRAGASSVNVFRLDSRAAIAAAATLVGDLVVQRFLPDAREEYTAGVVGSAAAQSFAWIVLRRDLLQGTTYRTELVQDETMGRYIVAIAQALGVEGVCNFQFRLVDGQPFVFEINPRFSGTSGLRYLYGFNDPEMAFEQAVLGLPIRQPAVRPAVVLRYWNEVHLPGLGFSAVQGASAMAARPVVLPAPRRDEGSGVTLRALVSSDLDRFTETFRLRGQPFSRTRVVFESFVFKAGFQAVALYRLSHWLFERNLIYCAWSVARFNTFLTGADIEFNAEIGPGMFISHPVGIVIGRGTRIGRGVTIFQGVTCGVRSWHPEDITRFPTIGDRCSLFAHACVLGGVRVGDDCAVAAHAVLTRDLPDGALARGIPAVVVPAAERVRRTGTETA